MDPLITHVARLSKGPPSPQPSPRKRGDGVLRRAVPNPRPAGGEREPSRTSVLAGQVRGCRRAGTGGDGHAVEVVDDRDVSEEPGGFGGDRRRIVTSRN